MRKNILKKVTILILVITMVLQPLAGAPSIYAEGAAADGTNLGAIFSDVQLAVKQASDDDFYIVSDPAEIEILNDTQVRIDLAWALPNELELSAGDYAEIAIPEILTKEDLPEDAFSGDLLFDELVVGNYDLTSESKLRVVFNDELIGLSSRQGDIRLVVEFSKDDFSSNAIESNDLDSDMALLNAAAQTENGPQKTIKEEIEEVQDRLEGKSNEAEEKEAKLAEEEAKEEETEPNAELDTSQKSENVNDFLGLLDITPQAENGSQEITANIIDEIRLYRDDGSEYQKGDLISVDEDLRFELDWSLPNGHGYKSGDYFEFHLPRQFTVYNSLDGDLGDYGAYTVDMDGDVKFTFNEKVEAESDIKGTFWFDTELKESEITSTEETIELVVNDEVVQTVIVNVKPTGGQAIAKEGQPVDGNFNTEEVEWTVIVNTTRDSLKNAIINDPILAGQELILDSVKLTEVEVDLKGKVVKDSEVEVTGFANNSTKENLNIELGDTNKVYKLTFKTKLLEKDFKEGTTNYKNNAILISDGKENVQAGGSVSVTRRKFLEKTSSTKDEGHTIEWTVNANFTEQSLKTDDLITDEFAFTVGEDKVTDVFEIKSEDIEILQVDKFDDEGKATETSDAKKLFDITVEGNKVTYKLKEDTNKAFIIKYKTELKKGAYIHDDGVITNKFNLKGRTKTITGQVKQQLGKKTNDDIDYENKTINWNITINADGQDLSNFVLTDNFAGSKQQLVENSIKIEPVGSGATITPNSDNEGFEIDFGNIKEKYTITYQTKFIYDFGGEKEKPSFNNSATINYEVGDDNYGLEIGSDPEPNDKTKNNGAKNGIVNQETKEITWKVDINYNQLALTDAKVKDEIPDNQSLIDGSVKIYETSIASSGDITVGNEVSDDQFTVDASKNQVNIDFGTIDKSYRVEFKTKDKDGIYNNDEKYTNTAKFIPREGEVHNLTANVTLPNQGEFIGKTGTHNKEDWTIDWKIDVNKSLSTTSDFTVTDDLGDPAAQILLEDTIKVTKVGSEDELVEWTDSTGDEEKYDYKLTVEGNKFTIYFPGTITEAYEITYSSYIVAEETVDITNEAEIKSHDAIKGTTEKTETVKIKISTGGGTGEGSTGSLILEKFEADSKRSLKGVAFSLVKTVGSEEIVVRKGTTDIDGKLEWTGLQYGVYRLKETVPEGYIGDAEQTVTLSSEDPEGIRILPVKNTRKIGTVKIVKVDSSTDEILEGAEFKLVNLTTEQEYTFTTDDEGVISEEIPFGEYTVKEITAPEGYRITKDIPNINVEIDKTATIEVENVAYVDVEGQKNWIVDEGKVLPESITINLLRNNVVFKTKGVTKNENWEYSFKDLDKHDTAGTEISYAVKEEKIDGYIAVKNGYDLTNIQTTGVSGTKTWIDDNNPDRPDSITVHLLANGQKTGQSQDLTAADNWEYSFTSIPKYGVAGQKITYTVIEEEIDGYETSIDGFNLTNLRVGTIKISGQKYWKDEDPTDRPESIEVSLTREIKGEADENFYETQTVTPNYEGNWVYAFNELPEFDENGVAYKYTVKEEQVPENYISTVEGFNITNLLVGKTEVDVIKNWKNDKEENRPDIIKVDLLQNGEVIESVEIDKVADWKYSFTDLEKYDQEGKAYKYTVREKPVKGYETNIEETDLGFEINNTYVEEIIPTDPDDPDSEEDIGSNIPGEPDDKTEGTSPDVPKTGESRSSSLLGLALIVAGLALGVYAWQNQRPRKRYRGQ